MYNNDKINKIQQKKGEGREHIQITITMIIFRKLHMIIIIIQKKNNSSEGGIHTYLCYG